LDNRGLKHSKKHRLLIRFSLVLAALVAAYGSYGLYFERFNRLEIRIIDRLYSWRPKVKTAVPVAPDRVVHVDANLYFSRAQHARVIDNLARMNVSVQLFDFLFAEIISQDEDRQLVEASHKAGNVIYGLRFESLIDQPADQQPSSEAGPARLAETESWPVIFAGDRRRLYSGTAPLKPYPNLAAAARGLGFLNIITDPDGIVRRLPLVVEFEGVYYPSLALRAVCDYLKVPPQNISVKPGSSIILKDVRQAAGSPAEDIVIPIDEKGAMLLDATESWDDVHHYSSSEIYKASENPVRMDELKRELTGKIVVLSQVLEKGYKTRPIDRQAPLYPGAFHTLVVQNILAGSFLREVPEYANVLIQIGILLIVFLLSIRFSSPALSAGIILLSAVYISLAAGLFVYGGIIVQFTRPLLFLMCSLVILFVGLGIERAIIFAQTERARRMAEQELEIGRQIQAGFFPTSLPSLAGWELESHFQAARHVAGDFYDVFTLGDDKKVGLVVADVCDKGVGAALFMALFRSSIRVLSGTAHSEEHLQISNPTTEPQQILLKTIQSVNNYISITHEKAGMFATIFYAILDPATGSLSYINGGHEPPAIIGANGIKTFLNPTGPAVGVFPDLEFKTQTVNLEPRDCLVVYTDGVTDARSKSGESFSKERLLKLLTDPSLSAKELIGNLKTRINAHIIGESQFDDITILVLQRKGKGNMHRV
jgi:serine phosphatase RsbU (regulator of sigma subunit)/CHASE2 domain-containing sensor protein